MSEQFSATPQKKKPGPTPKATVEQVEALQAKLEELEAKLGSEVQVSPEDELAKLKEAIGKIAHYVGGQVPRICREYGIEVYQPQRKDMHRV